MPAAFSAGAHSRERKLSMLIRPPSAAGNRMPSRRGSSLSASITFARSGTRRRDRSVLAYVFSRPLANARRTVKTPASRSTSFQSAPNASSGRTPVPTQKIASGPNGPSSTATRLDLVPGRRTA